MPQVCWVINGKHNDTQCHSLWDWSGKYSLSQKRLEVSSSMIVIMSICNMQASCWTLHLINIAQVFSLFVTAVKLFWLKTTYELHPTVFALFFEVKRTKLVTKPLYGHFKHLHFSTNNLIRHALIYVSNVQLAITQSQF